MKKRTTTCIRLGMTNVKPIMEIHDITISPTSWS